MDPSRGADEMREDTREAARRIGKVVEEGGRILVVSHGGDTDGETSGAIAIKGISRAYGFDSPYVWDRKDGTFEVKGCQGKLDYMPVTFNPDSVDRVVEAANSGRYDMVVAFDWGSGLLRSLSRVDPSVGVVIGDHHKQDIDLGSPRSVKAGNIFEVNPNRYGLDEGKDACGATISYLVAKELDGSNADLAGIAVVGAKGDVQDFSRGGLRGKLHEEVLEDAASSPGPNRVEAEHGYTLYGRDTVPIAKAILTYYDRSGPLTRALVKNHGLDPDLDGRAFQAELEGIMERDWGVSSKGRTLSQLSAREQGKVFDGVYGELVRSGYRIGRKEYDAELVGEEYVLTSQPAGTKWHNATEYSTIMSACSKMDEHATAINALLGHEQSRGRAENVVYKGYKREIGRAIGSVKYRDRDGIRVADASGHRPTITGILAGIYVDEDYEKPMVSVVYSKLPDGGYKGSVRRPVDSSVACDELCRIAEGHGGQGGGHPFAAGFYAPDRKALDAILEDMDEYVGRHGYSGA